MEKVFGSICVGLMLLTLSACASDIGQNHFVLQSPEVSGVYSSDDSNDIKNKSAKELILPAETAYSWFKLGSTMEVDFDAQEKVGELVYYKVADDRYNTHEKMDKYLRTLFSDEIVKDLWNDEMYYIESDGFLYFMVDNSRNPNMFIEDESYSTKEFSDDKIIYTTVVTYSPEYEEAKGQVEYEFVMERINDNWVFTTFPFYW